MNQYRTMTHQESLDQVVAFAAREQMRIYEVTINHGYFDELMKEVGVERAESFSYRSPVGPVTIIRGAL